MLMGRYYPLLWRADAVAKKNGPEFGDYFWNKLCALKT